jgi:DNA-binding transcriptional LysR family regulator
MALDRLREMRIFARVARRGSFSEAARELRISVTAVSRAVAQLEEELATQLLYRTTRQVTLTEAGAGFLVRSEQLLADLDELEASARSAGGAEPRGLLRVAAGTTFGARHVAPIAAQLLEAHPLLELELELSDRHVDLVAEGFDVALRVGALPDSELVARRLARVPHVLCANASYLKRAGTPQRPEELAGHTLIVDTNQPLDWVFDGPHGRVSVRPAGRLRVNNAEVVAQLVIQGVGIGLLPGFLITQGCLCGGLQILLPEHEAPAVHVWALCPPVRAHITRTRVFIDMLAAAWSPEPWVAESAKIRLKGLEQLTQTS